MSENDKSDRVIELSVDLGRESRVPAHEIMDFIARKREGSPLSVALDNEIDKGIDLRLQAILEAGS